MKIKIISLITLIVLIASFSSLSSCIATEDDSDTPSIDESVVEIFMRVGSREFEVILYDNETSRALKEKLPLTIMMSDMPHEKYYNLPYSLPTNSQNASKINAGDIMLWRADCLVIFYETFDTTYSYTPIGKIKDTSNLAEVLGAGSVEIAFAIN